MTEIQHYEIPGNCRFKGYTFHNLHLEQFGDRNSLLKPVTPNQILELSNIFSTET